MFVPTCVSEHTQTWIMYVVVCLRRIDPEQEHKFKPKQRHKSEVSGCCGDWQCLRTHLPGVYSRFTPHGLVSCVCGLQSLLNLEIFALRSVKILYNFKHIFQSCDSRRFVSVVRNLLTNSHTLLSLLKAIIKVSHGNRLVLFRLAWIFYGMEFFKMKLSSLRDFDMRLL